MPAMATVVRDSRDIITPEAFRVADHLIGTPLAKPIRRLWAILVDLLLVAILVGLLDAIAFLFAVAGAFVVFRLSKSKADRWYQRFFRRGLGCFGAILVFAGIMVLADIIAGDDDDSDADFDAATISADSGEVHIEGLGAIASGLVLRDGMSLRNANRAGERDTLATRIVERIAEEADLSPAELRSVVGDLDDGDVMPAAAIGALEAAVETTSARLENRAPRSADQILAADSMAAAAAALAAAQPDSMPPEDSALVAARDSITALAAELEASRAAAADLARERDAAQARTESGAFRWVLSSIVDELGLGLGWLGLYFTAFSVLGNGQTPGKRLFRLRIIRLDGMQISWWTSLQRFGGYSASVFTGMLGFAEMFWDDNRQALQDKLVHTVVIQETKQQAAAGGADLRAPATVLERLRTSATLAGSNAREALPLRLRRVSPGGPANPPVPVEPEAQVAGTEIAPSDGPDGGTPPTDEKGVE